MHYNMHITEKYLLGSFTQKYYELINDKIQEMLITFEYP